MTQTIHTPGKLKLDTANDIVSVDGWGIVAADMQYMLFKGSPLENKRRIIACWNACEDIETEWLKLHKIAPIIADVKTMHADFATLRDQNTRLLEVLTIISKNAPRTLKESDLADFGRWFVNAWEEDIRAIIARAAISKDERKK